MLSCSFIFANVTFKPYCLQTPSCKLLGQTTTRYVPTAWRRGFDTTLRLCGGKKGRKVGLSSNLKCSPKQKRLRHMQTSLL